MSAWNTYSGKSTFIVLHTIGSSATHIAEYLLNVLCLTTAPDGFGDRMSSCSDLGRVDHCVVDLLDVQSSTILIYNSAHGKITGGPENARCTFVVNDADQSVAVATEYGSTILSELLNDDEDKAYHIRSPYGFTFVIIETLNPTMQQLASIYLRTVYTDSSITASQSLNSLTVPSKGFDTPLNIPGSPIGTKSPRKGTKSSINTKEKQPQKAEKLKKKKKVWDPVTGRIIPSLHPFLLVGDQYRLITPNSTEPIPFSNDIFEGKVLFMVNSDLPMDEKFTQRFSNDKNKFEVQVQGKFKNIPPGCFMYLGGEITRRMELGLLTKGVCTSLLQFCKSLNASLHHSYGDKENAELPHICAPFWTTVDRLVVTKPGNTPPPFAIGFPESPADRLARRASGASNGVQPTINTEDIYSFSLKTHYINLETWSVINVPLMKEFRLQTFWGESDMRFIAYFIDPKAVEVDSKGFPKLHTQAAMKRFFTMELQNALNHPEWRDNPTALYYEPQLPLDEDAEDSSDSDSEGEKGVATSDSAVEKISHGIVAATMSASSVQHSNGSDGDKDEDEEEDDHGFSTGHRDSVASSDADFVVQEDRASSEDMDDSDFFDTQDGYAQDPFLQAALLDVKKKQAQHQSGVVLISSEMPSLPIATVPTLGLKPKDSVTNLLSTAGTETFVRTVVEVDELRATSTNNRRTLYAFAVCGGGHLNPADGNANDGNLISPHASSSSNGSGITYCVLRSYKEWKAVLPLIKISKKPAYYSRLSESEQRRVQLDFSYQYLLLEAERDHSLRAKLDQFLGGGGHTESFLMSTILSKTRTTNTANFLPSVTASINSSNSKNGNNSSHTSLRKALSKGISLTIGYNQKADALESNVCVRTGNYQWSQEHLSLSEDHLVLKRPGKRLGSIVRHRIPLASVIDVRGVPDEEQPLNIPEVHALLITTFPRQYLLLVHGEEARDAWVYTIQAAMYLLIPSIGVTSLDVRDNGSSNGGSFAEASPSAGSSNGSANKASSLRDKLFLGRRSNRLPSTASNSNGMGEDDGAYGGNTNSYPASNADMVNAACNNYNAADLLAYPPNWLLADRVVLNARSFTAYGHKYLQVVPGDGADVQQLYDELNQRLLRPTPVDFVAYLLELILQLVRQQDSSGVQIGRVSGAEDDGREEPMMASLSGSSTSLGVEQSRLWMVFMDGVAMLQTMDVSNLDPASPEAVCLFLNLFHLILLHGLLVMGPPTSVFKWQALFRTCAYEAFGDLFSLAELEHNIIKNGEKFLLSCFCFLFSVAVRFAWLTDLVLVCLVGEGE